MRYVTYEELFLFVTMLIALLAYSDRINKHKK